MKKIIFFLFFNLIFLQKTFAKEEKTIFGFSLEFPSSKFVILKETNDLTIKEFFKQNGYRDKSLRVLPSRDGSVNKPTQLTTSDVLEKLYKSTKDENGKKIAEVVIYMGGVVEKDFPIEIILINFDPELKITNQFRDRKSLEGLCNEFLEERQTLKYCEFENIKTKKQTIEVIKSKFDLITSLSKKVQTLHYLVNYNNGTIHFAINCHMSCKKIDESFTSIISSIK